MDATENALFALLENSAEEPVFRRAIDEARVLNAIFEQEGDRVVDEGEMAGVMTMLDDNVRELMGETVYVTGYVQFADPDRVQQNGNPVLTRQWVIDMPVVFNGFVIDRNLPPEYYDNDDQEPMSYPIQATLLRAAFHGRAALLALRNIPADSYEDPLHACTIDLDSIVKFENMSKERSIAFLAMSYPDIAEELDMHILSHDNEIGVLLSLRSYEINHPVLDREAANDLIIALESYINSLVSFDTRLPYYVSVKGDVLFENEEGSYDLVTFDFDENEKMICYLREVSVLNATPAESDDIQLGLYIKVEALVSEDHNDEITKTFYIKCDAITILQSIRKEIMSGGE